MLPRGVRGRLTLKKHLPHLAAKMPTRASQTRLPEKMAPRRHVQRVHRNMHAATQERAPY